MINCHNLKGLSDASVVSLTKNEYSSEVHFLKKLVKSLVLMSDELLQFVEKLFCLRFLQ